MLKTRVTDDGLMIGKHFCVTFQRTLRIPDDGSAYPLPPALSRFPIFRVADYEHRVPEPWRRHGGVFIPMYQREALWLQFSCTCWRPCAVKVAVGKVNALTGKRLHKALHRTPQNYLVCPDQPSLDGFHAAEGYIRQFVAPPLCSGCTVEDQITSKEEFSEIQLIVYDPKPGRFRRGRATTRSNVRLSCAGRIAEMGLGAGGRMKQKICPDPYGVDTWDQQNYGRVYVHIVNSLVFREITGMEPPPTPITAHLYTEFALPWYEVYDEETDDITPAAEPAKVRTVKQMDKKKGPEPRQDHPSVCASKGQIARLKQSPQEAEDGNG